MKKIVLVILTLFLGAACSGPSSPSKATALQFMEAYYVKADLTEAKKFAAGLALEKIDSSIALTEGQTKDKTTHQPRVSYHLEESRIEGEEANYLFLVKIEPEKVAPIQKKTLLKLRDREGWKVTQFSDYVMENQ